MKLCTVYGEGIRRVSLMGIHTDFKEFVVANGKLLGEMNFGFTMEARPKAIYLYDDFEIGFDLAPRNEENTVIYIEKFNEMVYVSPDYVFGSIIMKRKTDADFSSPDILQSLLDDWRDENVVDEVK